VSEAEALLDYLAQAAKSCTFRNLEAGQRPALEMTLSLDMGQSSPLLERWVDIVLKRPASK
jgi:hypothetical protein